MKLKSIIKTLKANKGITLISLIVTILVLVLLAGISINITIGDNGIIARAKNSSELQEKASLKEEIRLTILSEQMKKASTKVKITQQDIENILSKYGTVNKDEEGNILSLTPTGREYEIPYDEIYMRKIQNSTILEGQTATNGNMLYKSAKDTAIIPKGFTVSNVTGVVEGTTDETSIEYGLVIYDIPQEDLNDKSKVDWSTLEGINKIKENYNQWVWIPVDSLDLALMYEEYVEEEEDSNTSWALIGNTGVTTKLKSKSLVGDFKLGNRQIQRVSPGESLGAREPDLVIDTQNSISYDNNKNFLEAAGFQVEYGENGYATQESIRTYARTLVDDYRKMIESIQTYGGFYVGRYELGKDTQENYIQRPGKLENQITWYESYKICKDFGKNNDNIETRLIWGNQWDQVCRFINTRGEKVNINNSDNYGNYDDLVWDNSMQAYVTGKNDNWITNNIYDLAGNCAEWTQEAQYNSENNQIYSYRVLRGGYYVDFSQDNGGSVSMKTNAYPSGTSSCWTARPSMYIK